MSLLQDIGILRRPDTCKATNLLVLGLQDAQGHRNPTQAVTRSQPPPTCSREGEGRM